ncbi:MAG TPA: phage holin family protein [Candidatus Saccharimonadales bacterium]|nr:phage holin family protein [Candidatus Saccharimonadales bacterium]
MEILVGWLVSTLAIIVTAYLLPGVHIDSLLTALTAAVVLGIINSIIKPILLLLTLPINFLSLGLFTFIINALLVILATKIVPGFFVDGFWWALAFSIVQSLVNSVLHNLTK